MNNNANNNAEGGMAEEVERLVALARGMSKAHRAAGGYSTADVFDRLADRLSTEQAKRVEAEAPLASVHEEYALCRQLLMERTGERDQARAALKAMRPDVIALDSISDRMSRAALQHSEPKP